MMGNPTGGYYWIGLLRDGTQIEQLNEEGAEQTVELLRSQELAMIHLVPLPGYDFHPYIILEVGEGEEWLKHCTRSEQSTLGGRDLGRYTTDVLGLHSERSVRTYIYPDGSIRITTSPEQEGWYAPKGPGYQGPYPYFEDRRYILPAPPAEPVQTDGQDNQINQEGQ